MKVIAVAGKGGTGKTTLSALVILALKDRGMTPILAVDADPNYNLGEALGIAVDRTLGSTTEEFISKREKIPPGMTKGAVLEMKMHEAVIEDNKIDLIVMGRPEGPGCYCFINNLLRKSLSELSSNYKVVVIDNEAGMEHLSRKTTAKIDLLLLSSDHTIKGIRTAGRLRDLAMEMELSIGEIGLVVNRVEDKIDPMALGEIEKLSLDLYAVLPDDPDVNRLYLNDAPISELGEDSPLRVAINVLVEKTMKPNSKAVGD